MPNNSNIPELLWIGSQLHIAPILSAVCSLAFLIMNWKKIKQGFKDLFTKNKDNEPPKVSD